MIYLNRGYFYPMLIFISILLMPIIVMGFLWFFATDSLTSILGIVVVAIIYLILIWLVKKVSKSDKHYLIYSSSQLEIHYPNITHRHMLVIENEKVIQFDYCRLASIKAWFLIPVYDLPQCVFITFMDDGVKVCKLIGYMSYSNMQALAEKTNIKLIVH